MATPFVFKNVKVYKGGYDLSGYANEVALGCAYDEADMTVFSDQCRHATPGLCKVTFSLKGLGCADGTTPGPDDVLYEQLAGSNEPMTICPLTGAAGEVGKFINSLQLTYEHGGRLGDAYRFTASGVGQKHPLVHGRVMATGTKTASGSGTAYQLGAVSADQRLYGVLHVIAAGGTLPTLDVTVQSDDAEGFASPTTRLTFTQKSAIGAEFITPVAGPITDTWWRVSWAIGGTTPTFGIVACVGIL